MNMQQAGDRSETILDKTFQGIHPPVKWEYDAPSEIACSTGVNQPAGTTQVRRGRVVTTVISKRRRGGFLGVVQRSWEKLGYEITSVNADEEMPAISARTPDGFAVSLGVGTIGNVFFSVSSPCAEPSPVTYPKGTPGKPGGPDVHVDLTPRHHSEFWSSSEPLS
ncbi:hypothetical protein [Streptomyces mobaraensis]|uniref:hypothetical protein n=1 Tax=Streptomyces mobaraensis TaxID=35621 RepID=UPI00340138F6